MGSTFSKTSPKKKRSVSYYVRGNYDTTYNRKKYYKKKYLHRDDILKVRIYKDGRLI
tara:strand:- start:14132 stop:14302 length:171 start_codon:yes stop_codon:yes gene_type:complete